MNVVLRFILMGFLGGVAYVLINGEKWRDLTSYKAFRRYVLGAITGFVYNALYSDWSFPNFVMCFVSGYSAVSFIEGLATKVKAIRSK